MGLFRKMSSVMTAGAVDFRSDKERTARYTKKNYKLNKKAAKEEKKQQQK